MPIELSSSSIALFVVTAGAVMAYQAWFYIATTLRPDQRAAQEDAEE